MKGTIKEVKEIDGVPHIVIAILHAKDGEIAYNKEVEIK